MAKMTVIYKTPKDIASFERHYFDVHIRINFRALPLFMHILKSKYCIGYIL